MRLFVAPALYYPVERNSTGAVALLLEYGADPNDYLCFDIPLLAFAIIHGRRAVMNTTGVVKQLLAYGTDPYNIPQYMWIRFLNTPKVKKSTGLTESTLWCNDNIRAVLAPALHLTHRYSLYRASRLKKHKNRELQIATENEMVNLLKIPYFLIGQLPATKLVMTRVFNHTANQKKNPLVMAFSGLSSHDKTEMAIQRGYMLSAKHIVIDCAQLAHRMDLLGSTSGYHRSDEGSEMNSFIAENSGKRAVIFLDEFDKTEEEIRESLLIVVDKGQYTNRRNNRRLDASHFIWILATNHGDDIIRDFYEREIQELDDEAQENVSLAPLQGQLKDAFMKKFGIRQDIDLRSDVNRYIGHINLDLIDDGKLCSMMVDKHYQSGLGARSLERALDVIENKLTKEYGNTDELATKEANKSPFQKYLASFIPQTKDVEVYKDEEMEEEDD